MTDHPLRGSTVLITGGTGAWGRELTTQILERFDAKEVRVYSRGEHPQVLMRRKFSDDRLRFIVGDVRNKNILGLAMKDVDYCFHLAALKHIPICEENTWEAILTNIYGTQNIIECAMANGVKMVVDASSDKAVDPFNLYGVTKACGEKMIVNANQNYTSDTRFVCVRGGNVVGTTGSVMPLFKQQIKENNGITVTDPEMTRFLMSTRQAIGLVLKAVERAVGGELFVMKMPATSLATLAETIISLLGNENTTMETIGRRPGEKKHEALISRHESPFAKDIGDDYYVLTPQYKGADCEAVYADYPSLPLEEFSSENAEQLDAKSLEAMLRQEQWLFDPFATGPITL